MLCKVSNSTITGATEKLQTKNADSTSITVNWNETTVVSSYSIADLKSYKFKADKFNMGGTATWYYLYVYFYINSTLAHTENFSLPYTWTLNNIETQTYTNSASGNTAIMIKAKNWVGRNGTLTNWVLEFTSKVNITINKQIFTHKSKPRELKGLWNKARATLFGYHTNNTWYTGE